MCKILNMLYNILRTGNSDGDTWVMERYGTKYAARRTKKNDYP